MKIVHVINYFHPMLGYQETFLPREQARSGHDVHMVTSDRYEPLIYANNKNLLGNRIVGAGVQTQEGVRVWRLKALFEVPHDVWMLGLEAKIRQLEPDIVIVHGMVNSSAVRVARLKKKLRNFKLVYDDHMAFQASHSPLRIAYPLFKRTFSPLIQETADALIGVADTSKMFMHERYGIPLDRITVIPLGADDDLFRFDECARQQVRHELAITRDDTVFIYAGKVINVKGPHLLVEAAIRLMSKHHNLKVALVGNGPRSYLEEMKERVRREHLEGRFVWHDAVPNHELYRFYSASDVAVWPRESSLSMMEAMACSLPVVISDTSETTERIAYGNGLTYRGDNAPDLANQMERLLDLELRRKMGRNSRRLVEEKLSWKIIARQFIELVSP